MSARESPYGEINPARLATAEMYVAWIKRPARRVFRAANSLETVRRRSAAC